MNIRAGLLKQIEELNRDLEAVNRVIERQKAFGGNGINGTSVLVSHTDLTQKSYDPKATWKEKILYVVRELGSGYSDDIAKKLQEHEPDMNLETAQRNAVYYLSHLYMKGRLKADKTGRRYKYSP